MSKTHIVKQGETLSSIALEHGFQSFRTIFNHPGNAELRSRRDPHVLFPGDQVFIPDPEPKTEKSATGKLHRFVLKTSQLFLRLRLLDVNGRPLANTVCEVGMEAGKGPDLEITDAKGTLEKQIAANVRQGEVHVHLNAPPPPKNDPPPKPPPAQKVKFDLLVGSLNPEFKFSGQQARLNNMGYFAGYTLKDLDQLLWAAEEFACDKIAKPVTKRPRIEPAPPEGEEDQTKSDPVKRTGITDEPIFKKIKLEHGI